MKKIFTILLTAGAACLISETASAQSLKDLFSKDNIKDVVENVTGLDLSKDEAVITGTWQFSGTAVELESKDILKKAAAKLAVETIEKKLDETIAKIGNMTDDDLCTLLIAETLVWIYICLVLCEECRILHLADIVIQSPSTYELTIGSNAISCFSSKIGHLQGVLEGAWCNF